MPGEKLRHRIASETNKLSTQPFYDKTKDAARRALQMIAKRKSDLLEVHEDNLELQILDIYEHL